MTTPSTMFLNLFNYGNTPDEKKIIGGYVNAIMNELKAGCACSKSGGTKAKKATAKKATAKKAIAKKAKAKAKK